MGSGLTNAFTQTTITKRNIYEGTVGYTISGLPKELETASNLSESPARQS